MMASNDAAPRSPMELRAPTSSSLAPQKTRSAKWQPNGKMRNPARERMKQEIVSLRSQVVELEAQLQEVVAQRNVAARYAQSEAICQREAALLNRRLRNQLRLKLTSRRKLMAMLAEYERRLNAKVLPLIHPEPIPVTPHLLHDDYGYRFVYLSDKVAGSLRNLDVIMASAGQPNSQQSITTSITSRAIDGQDHLVVLNKEAKTFQCDLATWCGATWRAIDESACRNYREVVVYHSDERKKVTRQYFEREHHGVLLHFVTSVVVQQVVEMDRVRIVYETVTSCDDYTASDVCVEESGWLSCRTTSTPDGDVITMELVRHAVPRLIGEEAAGPVMVKPEARVVLNACLAITSEDEASISDLSENLLIEELMAMSL